MKRSQNKTQKRSDIHADITNQIVAAIEGGSEGFELPWHRSGNALKLPRNAVTGKRYNGVNILSLWMASRAGGFTSPFWATYRQWQSIGAQVQRGEQSAPIVFYKQVEIEAGKSDTEDGPETRLMARASRVFNAGQVEGFQADVSEQHNADLTERLSEVDTFIAETSADIRHGGERAYYVPSADYIRMPERERFVNSAASSATEGYYAVLLHELTHWTGHSSRLDRQLQGRFGDDAYAMEELVAELGAAFLCGELGISSEPRTDHAAYLASWLKVLKSDARAVITAASKASEAAGYLAGMQKGSP